MDKVVSISEAGKISGVTTRILKCWDMVQDIISIVTCFSAKLYGARGGRRVKRTLAELEKERRAVPNEDDTKSSSC